MLRRNPAEAPLAYIAYEVRHAGIPFYPQYPLVEPLYPLGEQGKGPGLLLFQSGKRRFRLLDLILPVFLR